MTEIERMLTETLAVLEQELRQKQEAQGITLATQQHTLATHVSTLHQLQQQISRLSAQQQESMQQLQRLSSIHERLEPLLVSLNNILNTNARE